MASAKSGYEGKIAGLYDLDRTLGKGHFAVVKLARHVFTGELVAVKVIDKTKLDSLAAGHLLQEVRCMKLVQHPNVVRLYEVIDTQTKLYLILELGDGGDMYDYILRHEGGVSEAQAKVHFAQIVRAISYCHRLHVVHRDLKPENVVFFRQQGTVKLTDFGFSNHFQPGTMLMTSCGSLAYSAPEILLGEEYDAPAVDIWSLGVILYMLVCGQPPFQEANDSETLIKIMDCQYSVPPHVSEECRDLISHMLQRDPEKRASLQQIEGHPWLRGVDPSPASRSTVPLTSYKSLSQEEHSMIIQAMTCGNIADCDTIQEALEADRYNHITATYFLLAERILREKQEHPGQAPSAEGSWTAPCQQRRPLSEPFDWGGGRAQELPGEIPGHQSAEIHTSAAGPGPDVPETSPIQAEPQKPLDLCAGRENGNPFSENSVSQQVGLLLRSSGPGELPPTKNIRALQQICEEDEEEEEEGVPLAPYNECKTTPPHRSDKLTHWEKRETQHRLDHCITPKESFAISQAGAQGCPLEQENGKSKQRSEGKEGCKDPKQELQVRSSVKFTPLGDELYLESQGQGVVMNTGSKQCLKDQGNTVHCQAIEISQGKESSNGGEDVKESRAQEGETPGQVGTGGETRVQSWTEGFTEEPAEASGLEVTTGEVVGQKNIQAHDVAEEKKGLLYEKGIVESKDIDKRRILDSQEAPREPSRLDSLGTLDKGYKQVKGQEKAHLDRGPTKQVDPMPQHPQDEIQNKPKNSSRGIKNAVPGEGEEGAIVCHLLSVQCCQDGTETADASDGEAAVKEHNNNMPKMELQVPSAASSPRALVKNHCVDMGPDSVETRTSAHAVKDVSHAADRAQWGVQEGEGEVSSHFKRSRRALGGKEVDFCSRGGVYLAGGYDMGPEPMIRVDPTKMKNVNLRDRLLQFPLCEKALSFKIKPTSKESLMPLGQFNCCHVL
nr:PREDICTED: SNF-related serine/threonine-protein kinase-like [Lepisosteus oculatus]